ncbi:8494_t:CDS:1 [Funneliformis geosporum]|uniref:8478_t:CDS:1 n=1 Tax=Funneliformis geosporum TaxID=1117311 RepID=A0A9W4SD52_9GLOM|nr:8478_t:CDS:1 [Funneliformis geosporum]CAI2166645.1 8494_t:CDS:1 [Funneliformis geosporum]
MNTYALVAAALSKITNMRIVSHDEYLMLLQNDNNSDYNYQIFNYNSLHKHETYLVKSTDSSNHFIAAEVTSSDDDIVSSHDVEIDNSTNNFYIENIFIKKFLGGTLTIKDLNVNSTVSQLKNKIYEAEGIPPDDQCLIIGNIFIKKLSGETITFRNINANTSVSQLKNVIYKTERIPSEELCLRYDNKTLQDHQTLKHYEITNDTTIYLTLRIHGGSVTIHILDFDFLDPPFDFDFTNMKCSGESYMRGNYQYHRPYGWRRIALKVLDQFDDNSWLGVNKRVTNLESVEGEWIVSYHGTTQFNANSIAKDGFLLSKGKRFVFGHGIYSTPNIEVAVTYAEEFNYEGEKYRVVFQNRVKPGSFKVESNGEIFVTDNDRYIRPYGLCIQKV